MTTKTENKIILYFCLIWANVLIWNFAQAEFKDWTKDIAPGLAVVDSKIGLDGVLLPKMIYEPTFDAETTDEANNKQLEDLNTEEIKEVASAVPTADDDQPRWKEEVKPLSSSEESKNEIRRIAQDIGFKDVERLIAIGNCESRFKPVCGIVNHPACTNPVNKSYDRGWFQISRRWHPEVSDECAVDLECATLEAIRIYEKSGNNFGQWACNNLIK